MVVRTTHTGLQQRGGEALVIRTAWCTRRTTHRGEERREEATDSAESSRALERCRAENRGLHFSADTFGSSLQADRGMPRSQEAKRLQDSMPSPWRSVIETYDWAVRNKRLGQAWLVLYFFFLVGMVLASWRGASPSILNHARHADCWRMSGGA